MELLEAIERLKGYVEFCKNFKDVTILDTAIEIILKEMEMLKQNNEQLKDLYIRTARKLEENGKTELAEYFLAQINMIPTWVEM